MKAFVTGATGFVGRHLVKHLLDSGDTVIGSTVDTKEGLGGIDTVPLDITDYGHCVEFISKYQPDVVYHLAGIAFVPEAESNFAKALAVNVGGTHNLVRAAHLLAKKTRFLLVSSAEVYGRVTGGDIPVKETQLVRPANNYSLTKLMAELVVQRYADAGTIEPYIMRPFNHIGPGQSTSFVAASFASQLAAIKKGLSKPVLQVGNLTPQRDFSDVRDIVRAYRLAVLNEPGVYNLGSGRPTSIQELLNILIDISGLSVEVELDPTRQRPAEVPILYGDISKAKEKLGWQPIVPLRDTLEAIYDALL